MTLTEPDVVTFLRYIADPSRNFDRALFDQCLSQARHDGYVSVQWKGQVVLTPCGRARLALASRPMDRLASDEQERER